MVRLDGDTVASLAEKPQHRELVNAGIYVLEPAALALLERETYADMTTLLAQIMESDLTVGAYRIHEDWMDVGRPEDLARARELVDGLDA